MKVMVFSSDTALFYKNEHAWTATSAEAFDFEDTHLAARFCHAQAVQQAQIILEFGEGLAPLTVPAGVIPPAEEV